MSIYIHIPFCQEICTYCDFCKMYYLPQYIDTYLDNLKKEILSRYQKEKVRTIYIGGGTPTSLSDEELTRLLELTTIFNLDQDIEFTIESNVESLTETKLQIMKKYGVNRISIGVQSFNSDALKLLGRTHTKEETIKKIKLVKKYFSNINIDLIYAAYDNLEITKEDIEEFLKLDIPHLSAYSLIIEDHTMLKVKGFQNIDEDTDYEMYKYIENLLEKNGYDHYEISNYAKPGFASKHNLVYWNNEDYYGFGLSSTSYLNHKRRVNTKNLTKYLNGEYLGEVVKEDRNIQIENEIMLGLRKTEGINLETFKLKYHTALQDIYDISSLLRDGYLIIKDNYLRINKKYLYISNEILVRILS